MADKIHKTRGIVLKTVKYGETSLIVSVYTELFGLQSYLLNGVRTISKKGGNKISHFQPGAILDMEVYHNELKQLNRVKEYRWALIYKNIFTDVLKNGVTAYMVELLLKCLSQPERNEGIFAFVEDCLLALDNCDDAVMANFPMFYAVQLTYFFGFRPQNNTNVFNNSEMTVFDIEQGIFTTATVLHKNFLENKYAPILSELLMVRNPNELAHLKANTTSRGKILDAMEIYYNIHIQNFGKMKSLPVLKTIMR